VLTGAACHTEAGKLQANHIIHTVGPFYSDYSPEVSHKLL